MKNKEKNAVYDTLKFTAVGLIISFLCILFGYFADRIEERNTDVSADGAERAVRVIIDAGHGGIDGGASGADGTLEKDINLKVAEAVYGMLSANGIPTVMTRTEDIMLHELYGDFPEGGKRKMYDLKNRVRFASEYGDAVFVSIHMNSFPNEKYSGLQVYFSPNSEESRVLAEAVQNTVGNYLQPENKREIKRADSSIYILDHIKQPAVLIECGFLSNPDECAHLNDEEYRKKLALTVSSAITEYIK